MGPRAYVEIRDNDDDLAQYGDSDVCFKAIGRTIESSSETRGDVSAGHNWPTELEQTCPDWTEAFKGLPLSKIKGRPSRLVHIQSGQVVRLEQEVQYAAVSYVWSQWENIEDLLCRLRGLMEPTGLLYCWIDQRCIDQKSEDDKKAEISRMRNYYAKAAITYVMVPEWSARFTWEVPGFSMRAEQTGIARAEVSALEKTMWASRIWTFQEASLSGRTVFVGSSVVKSAAELAVANMIDGFQKHIADGLVPVSWRRTKDGGTYIGLDHLNFSRRVGTTHLFRDRVVLMVDDFVEHYKTEYKYLDSVWRASGVRNCKEEEDRVYGMLGLVRGGDAVAVEYGIGFEEAVRRAAEKGLVSSGILLAESNSQELRRSWCPAPGTESRFIKSCHLSDETRRQPIQVTAEGLCIVQAARFRMPDNRREKVREYKSSFQIPDKLCRGEPGVLEKFKGRGDFRLEFYHDVPEGEEWQGDWLAVADRDEEEDGEEEEEEEEEEGEEERKNRKVWYHGNNVVLVQYKTTEGGRPYKLHALEAMIGRFKEEYIGDFALG